MKHVGSWIVAIVAALSAVPAADAGIVVYEEGNKKVEIGARIQVQYLNISPDEGESEDTIFFRRLRPYIAGTVTENWYGKLQFDFGKTLDGNEVAIKDAYVQYKGWENATMFIGSSKSVFSREFLTSSKRQQVIERGFVGDHNFGTPDRMLGLRFDGHNASKKVQWKANFGSASHDPDVQRIDYDNPANDSTDWNQGWIAAARLDIFPNGPHPFDQGDFHSDSFKYSFSVAAYTWANDDDVLAYTDDDGNSIDPKKADLDAATGFEISAGLRGFGWSADAEYHLIQAETVDSNFTGGIYLDGATDLDQLHLEGGYMIPGNRFEIVGKYQTQDADNYETAWEAIELGVNYFLNKHKTKVQLGYRLGANVQGVEGVDQNTATLQFQFVF